MRIVILVLLLLSVGLFAQEQRNYGMGQPKTTQDLPPGQLRRNLEALPDHAKEKALKRLQRIEFPAQDIDQLRVTPNGDILYTDPAINEPHIPAGTLPIEPDQVLMQHSRPGSNNVLYLDFDGMVITNTWWNKNADPHVALPFDPSGDGPEFSEDELSRIYNIWQRVSEDFAAFDVDVTTQEPTTFTATTGRVLVTRNNDANGVCIYYCGVGGIAYLNYFNTPDYVAKFSPALVFWDNLTNGTASYTAEASSHEFGHNIGLSHDGLIDSATYYRGHGLPADLNSWAPIMGASYYRNVTQWSKGDYDQANNLQDDFAIIAGDLGLAPDADGIINGPGDVDTLLIEVTEAGVLAATITPVWGAYGTPLFQRRGANLDIRALLMAPDGTAQTFTDPVDTGLTFEAAVAPGRYDLQISADSSSNYSTYATQGSYLTKIVITPGDPDPPENQPPEAVIDYLPSVLEYRRGRGLQITFDGSESTDSDGQVVSYRWKINNRLKSSTAAFTTTLRKGTYTISLAVTDDRGAEGITAQQITVKRVMGR